MPEAAGSIHRHRPPVGEPVESVARESEGSSLVQARTFSPELHQGKQIHQFRQDYFHESSALLVEQRFKSLRKWIRKSYRNKVLIYQNPALPRSQTNPIKPAADIWIGPCAMNWLEADPANHWVQPFRQSNARGYLVDLVELDLTG